MAEILTLAEYKTRAGITGTDYDTQLTAILSDLNDWSMSYMNIVEDDITNGMKLVVFQMLQQIAGSLTSNVGVGNEIKSQTIDGDSVSFETTADLLRKSKTVFDMWKKDFPIVKFNFGR